MNYHVINLTSAPYDTVTLVAKPYSASGALLPMTDARVQWIARDTTALSVTSDGHVTPIKVGIGTWVVAAISIGQVTQRDSTWVTRLANEPVITGISAAPVGTDTTIITPGRYKALPVFLTGTNLAGVAVYYDLPDTAVAYMRFSISRKRLGMTANAASTGRVSANIGGMAPGTVMVRVMTTVRGVTWVDSVPYIVRRSWATAFVGASQQNFRDGTKKYVASPDTTYIAIGGVVSLSSQGHAIVFDDPSKALPGEASGPSAVGGNIEPWTYSFFDATRKRSFGEPGIVHWTIPDFNNVTGTIVVFDETTCLSFDCPPGH
jgi:hypothetical protein